jgi:putative ABC transport system permease protein
MYRINFGKCAMAPFLTGEEMKKDFPEVKDFFRINVMTDFSIKNDRNEMIPASFFAEADPSIFKILGIKFITGTPASGPSEVAISEKMAKNYFGSEPALGKVIHMRWFSDFIDLNVTGVYKDFPANSSLYPEFVSDLKLYEKLFTAYIRSIYGEYGKDYKMTLNWDTQSFYTYILLNKNTDKQMLLSKIEKYKDNLKNPGDKTKSYSFQPMSETHLKSGSIEYGSSYARTGNSSELKYYWAISFLILLISMTNYIFLTRASTTDRLHEIGTRKVLGASQFTIRRQIIVESTLVTFMSLIPASFLIDPGMSFINNTLHRTLNHEVFSNPVMWIAVILTVILIGTLSGFLISFNISRIPALLLLSGKNSRNSKSAKWDYSFLIFHFSLYIILVVSVLIVNKQLKYSSRNIKGLNSQNIIITGLSSDPLKSGFATICNEMEKVPGVVKVAGGNILPPLVGQSPISLADGATGEKNTFDGLMFGEGMATLLGMELVEGSDFGAWKYVTDIIFNESAAKKLNIKVGDKYMNIYNVIGIVKDFNAHSVKSEIGPMVIIQQNPEKMGMLAIKTNGLNDQIIIKKLREIYNQIDPNELFTPRYMEELTGELYANDRNQGKITAAFSVLAAILAIMGLYGIAMISIARKRKEIGLRKVNGAEVREILILLNSDFVKWVLFSMIIAVPVSFYISTAWLRKFAYKTELSWWVFAIAGVSAILIAVLTVSWQSWRAATRNPVVALRYE